ncbi:MAG: maleylpyruvate isomerase N-terminal domain-containing protein [Actinomycetota bacterium]|nr:maleylpyruvate isomerase N-terminal domain-containing protein [Actinomycetota bacterium]
MAQRGREAGAALGADPAAAVQQLVARVLARVDAAEQDVLVATPVGVMRLGDYLPTRTFELTVHTCDLAAALGQPLDVPQVAAVDSCTLLGELAARAGRAGPLLPVRHRTRGAA